MVSVLKSSRFVPEEVDRLKEIGELKEKIRNCADEAERGKLGKNLQERQLALALLTERNKRRKWFQSAEINLKVCLNFEHSAVLSLKATDLIASGASGA